jgi:anti-sigma B factor antagonist
MPEPLQVERVEGGLPGQSILRLRGPITVQNLFPFQTAERECRETSLILDVRGVPYIDSVGVGALVGAYVSRNKEGNRVALVGVGERVKASLVISNLVQFFPIYPSVEAAQQSLS